MQALRIRVSGSATVVDLDDDGSPRFLESLRAAIGADCVECVSITDRWDAWLDEDSAATARPVNQAATRVARGYGASFNRRGTVIIVGIDRSTSAARGLTSDQTETIRRRITGELRR